MLDSSKIFYVTDPTEAVRHVAELVKEPVLGIDIETCPLPQYLNTPKAGLDPYLSRPRLLQVAALDCRVYVFDLDRIATDVLKPLSQTHWVTFNGSFEYRHLTHAGLSVPRLHDAQLLDRLVSHKKQTLAAAALAALSYQMDKSEQTSDWSGELSRSQIEYAAIDSVVTVRIAEKLLPRIHSAGQRRLYDCWRDALPVLAGLSLRGQTFEWDLHADLTSTWHQERQNLKVELKQHLGAGVNPSSGSQLGDWLERQLDNKTIKKWPRTPGGRLKTDKDTLALYAHVPAIQPLLRYKVVSTLLNTYNKGYEKHRHPVTGNLHPDFQIGFTRSGRISASKPNTQNPPRLEEFRELFIPRPGYTLVGADYSQIELRVAALLANDDAMLNVYRYRGDLHRKTAAAIAGIPLAHVTKEQRNSAKAVNFGNLYGQGAYGLARTAKLQYGCDITIAEAKQALNAFNGAYPQLAIWKRQRVGEAMLLHKVSTRLGLVHDFQIQGVGFLKGEAQNIPIQGSAAEVLLVTVGKLPKVLNGLDAHLYHNIHDELIVETSQPERTAEALRDVMVEGFLEVFPEGESLTGDLIEARIGRNWAEVH